MYLYTYLDGFSGKEIKFIMKYIKKSKIKNYESIMGTKIDNKGMIELSKNFKLNQGVIELFLISILLIIENNLGNDAMIEFSKNLMYLPNLSILNIYGNLNILRM